LGKRVTGAPPADSSVAVRVVAVAALVPRVIVPVPTVVPVIVAFAILVVVPAIAARDPHTACEEWDQAEEATESGNAFGG
ncbi:MAG: hypothetical protein ACRD6W_06245, partial [Nitrososphaerales archaeon]